MNYAYIDAQKKAKYWCIKPQIYNIKEENKLYVFPGKVNKVRLKKAMSKFNFSELPKNCNSEIKTEIWCKTISQAMKEYNFKEIVFCSEKHMDNIEILTYFFKENIKFSITPSIDDETVIDFFLEHFGLAVSVKNSVSDSLVVYFSGAVPKTFEKTLILDLSANLNCKKISVCSYFIKNHTFPLEIVSLPLLQAAMDLTETKIKDIIIKLCIIGTKCE